MNTTNTTDNTEDSREKYKDIFKDIPYCQPDYVCLDAITCANKQQVRFIVNRLVRRGVNRVRTHSLVFQVPSGSINKLGLTMDNTRHMKSIFNNNKAFIYDDSKAYEISPYYNSSFDIVYDIIQLNDNQAIKFTSTFNSEKDIYELL